MIREHDRGLTLEQRARADLLEVVILLDTSSSSHYYIATWRDGTHPGNCMRRVVPDGRGDFAYYSTPEEAIQAAASPAKHGVYWPVY